MNTRRTLFTLITSATCVMALAALPGIAEAQSAAQKAVLQKAIDGALQELVAHLPTLTPGIDTIDAKTHQAILTLGNVGDDTLDVALSMRNANPDDDSTPIIDNAHSLVAWVTGLPDTVMIPPHSTQRLTVTINMPTGVTSSEYSGWIVGESSARTPPKPDNMGTGVHASIVGQDGKTRKLTTSSKLVYKVQ